MELTLFVIATFITSAMLGWLMIPRLIFISKKKRLFDELSDRKSHKGNVPRLGGVTFFPAFLFSVCCMLGLRYYYNFNINGELEITAFNELLMLISGMTVLFFTGLTDDLAKLSYKAKFVAQILAGILLIYSGIDIKNLGGLFGIYEISALSGGILTVLLTVFLINAYNLIDGIDGLCSGLSLLTLYTFCFWFLSHELYFYAMIAVGMAGVVGIFFFYNTLGRRLKIFMGDTGSLTLGYLIAYLILKFYDLNIASDLYNIQATPAVVLGIVFVPAFDTLRVFCVRIASGLSPFHPDKRHIHHKLLNLGLNHIQSAFIIIGLQALFIVFNMSCKNININLLFAINIALGVLGIIFINFLVNRRVLKKELNKLHNTRSKTLK